MHRFFVPQLFGDEMTITGVDAKHISKVLRMTIGDELQIVSDDGVSALGKISYIDAECVKVGELQVLAESHEPKVKITLAQGLAKGEKIGAFGLTEPNAGSDAGGTETTAELKGDYYL